MLHSLQISLALLFATVSASRAAESSNSIRLVGSPAAPSLINPDGTHNQENANKDLIRVLRRFPQNLDYVALAQELEENGVVAQANLIQKATDSLVQAIAAAKISKANAATARSPAPTPKASLPSSSKSVIAYLPLLDIFNPDATFDSEGSTIDVGYYGAIQVGTPPQDVFVTFDTGSSDLVLPYQNCVDGNHCQADVLRPAKSSTFVNGTKPGSVQFAEGTSSGTLASDVVSIAGLNIAQQSFVAEDRHSISEKGPQRGLLGLGFSAGSQIGKPSVLDNIIAAHSLATKMFGLYLGRRSITGSELSIGAANSAHYTGSITYFDVLSTDPKHWAIMGANIQAPLGNTPLKTSVIVDSGSTSIILPTSIAKEFYARIPGSRPTDKDEQTLLEAYSVPCNTTAPMSFTFILPNGQESAPFSVAPMDFLSGFEPGSKTECTGGIFGRDIPAGPDGSLVTILGDIFLKSWYSVYTFPSASGVATVGFAASKA